MLYVMFSKEGRYFNNHFIEGDYSPTIETEKGLPKTFRNGCFDINLNIKPDPDSGNDIIRLAPDDGKTIYIVGQDSTVDWNADSYFGRKKGGVMLYRPRNTDTVIYELKPTSFFVSRKVVYHNEDGVLIKYSIENVLGWDTWDSLGQWFLREDVIDYSAVTDTDIYVGNCVIPVRHVLI